MKILFVKINNFRSIKESSFYCFPYMIFVGKNNSGKSNILKALATFFSKEESEDDFYRDSEGNWAKEISIKIMFCELNDIEKNLYKDLILKTNNLELVTIKKTIFFNDKQKLEHRYDVSKKVVDMDDPSFKPYLPAFDPLKSKKADFVNDPNMPKEFIDLLEKLLITKGHNRLATTDLDNLRTKYLSTLSSDSNIKLKYKNEWVEMKEIRSDPEKYLGKFFFIPAVQDIEKETIYQARSKGNLAKLIDYILDKLEDPDRMKKINKKAQEMFKEAYNLEDPNSPIQQLKAKINQSLSEFDSGKLEFLTTTPNFNKIIRDALKITIDDGIATDVQLKGHGMQRYFMITLFKIWAEEMLEDLKSCKKNNCESVYFAIEEPELFLHPQYQKMMKEYLKRIAKQPNRQILLNTHSPHFIEFSELKELVKVTKTKEEGTTCIQNVKRNKGMLEEEECLVHTFGNPDARKFHESVGKINMNYYLDPTRNEIFFADKVVLVEGQTEKMVIQAWAEYFFSDDIFMRNRITFVDCLGKFNIQNYMKVLEKYQIPFVVIIDKDSTSQSEKSQSTSNFIIQDCIDKKIPCIVLDPEFESEFINNGKHQTSGSDANQKKLKPYYAMCHFFNEDGSAKPTLDSLKTKPKFKEIMQTIYGKFPRS